jgi:5-methylcytosine-specific restriction endonuclease McrA
VPLHRGGTNDASNLQSLCKDCHAAKTAAEASCR